jgi:hypothetical protein
MCLNGEVTSGQWLNSNDLNMTLPPYYAGAQIVFAWFDGTNFTQKIPNL